MRESLFRGKRVDNGDWTYGYLFVCWDRCYILWGMSGDNPIKEEVVPETIGEYTGLKDQNGKKIFEGDIVRYRHEFWQCPMQSVVEYCVDKWNYPAFDLKDNDYYEANGLQLAHEMEIEFEVIGTIHDNPELLEDNRMWGNGKENE